MPTDRSDDSTSGSERGYDHNAQARGYPDAGGEYDVSTQVSISVEHSAASVFDRRALRGPGSAWIYTLGRVDQRRRSRAVDRTRSDRRKQYRGHD